MKTRRLQELILFGRKCHLTDDATHPSKEVIPVGCVPPTFVFLLGRVYLRYPTPDTLPLIPYTQIPTPIYPTPRYPTLSTTLDTWDMGPEIPYTHSTDRMTGSRENVSFLQLRWRAVKMGYPQSREESVIQWISKACQ